MPELNLDTLKPAVARKIRPFFTEVLQTYGANIHSVHVVGSALTGDYREGTSDINSIFVLTEMDLKFLEVLAPRGKKYRKEQVAAPLIMTPEYITKSRA
jgi:predicted nucleotidyltransferase